MGQIGVAQEKTLNCGTNLLKSQVTKILLIANYGQPYHLRR